MLLLFRGLLLVGLPRGGFGVSSASWLMLFMKGFHGVDTWLLFDVGPIRDPLVGVLAGSVHEVPQLLVLVVIGLVVVGKVVKRGMLLQAGLSLGLLPKHLLQLSLGHGGVHVEVSLPR